MGKEIILASQSPRRLELLQMLGFHVTVQPTDVDESTLQAESPAALTERLARLKAEAIAHREELPDAPILAADTVVDVDGEILGKPHDTKDAYRMLRLLSGRDHAVHTGIAIVYQGRTVSTVVTARVHFRSLLEAEIEAYIRSGLPMDKAGAYGIQGPAGAFVEGIDGDYFTVVGLPLCRTVSLLQSEFGFSLYDGDKC